MDNKGSLLDRRLERERRARKEAEKIIEEKSRELYLKGQELERIAVAERQARNEAELLRKALEAFTARLDVTEVVTRIEEFLKDLVPHDGGSIYFFEKNNLHRRKTWGDLYKGELLDSKITPTVLLREIRQSNQPVVVSGKIDDTIAREWNIHSESKTWMVAPISAYNRNIGFLTLESRQISAFNQANVNLIQSLANEAAIALENARLFQEIERLSTIDPLTGLYNRRYFNHVARLEFERSRRYDLPLSTVMMDIDHFKNVNDTYGHAAGDKVLMEVAACIRLVRQSDIISRHGGEEFCFLLPQTDLGEACLLAERVRMAVADLHFEFVNQRFNITASLGVANRLSDDTSVENIIIRSDQAMYQAKHNGRNRIKVWKPV